MVQDVACFNCPAGIADDAQIHRHKALHNSFLSFLAPDAKRPGDCSVKPGDAQALVRILGASFRVKVRGRARGKPQRAEGFRQRLLLPGVGKEECLVATAQHIPDGAGDNAVRLKLGADRIQFLF